MDKKTLVVEKREEFGKGPSRRLRSAGRIPAVMYGVSDPLHFSIDARDFHSKFKYISENTIINLEVGSENHQVLVKDYDDNIVTGEIDHLDFYEIEKGKTLKTHVPVHLEGNPKGVKEGGLLEHKVEEIEVECLPKDLPERITLDVSDLDLGESLHVSDIAEMEGVKVLNIAEQTIVVVSTPKAAVTEDESDGEEEAETEEE